MTRSMQFSNTKSNRLLIWFPLLAVCLVLFFFFLHVIFLLSFLGILDQWIGSDCIWLWIFCGSIHFLYG